MSTVVEERGVFGGDRRVMRIGRFGMDDGKCGTGVNGCSQRLLTDRFPPSDFDDPVDDLAQSM